MMTVFIPSPKAPGNNIMRSWSYIPKEEKDELIARVLVSFDLKLM